MNKIKWLLASTLFAGGLSLHAETDSSKEHSKISEYGRYIAQADVDGLVDSLVDDAVQEGVGVSKSYLEKYFKTVELTFTTAGSLKSSVKPTFEILVVAPLSDEEDIFNTTAFNFIFVQ